MRIEPTVGRVVHLISNRSPEPHAAIIIEVDKHQADEIKVFDCNDIVQRYVSLVQEGAPKPEKFEFYAVWMPYQKGQAAKTEELEKLVKAGPGAVVEVATTVALPAPGTPEGFKGTLNEAVAGLKGPHICAEDVNANIKEVRYFIAPDGRTTFCELVLQCGFTIHGRASVINKDNFKPDVGRGLAYQDAWKQIWALMAYNLANTLWANNIGAGANKV